MYMRSSGHSFGEAYNQEFWSLVWENFVADHTQELIRSVCIAETGTESATFIRAIIVLVGATGSLQTCCLHPVDGYGLHMKLEVQADCQNFTYSWLDTNLASEDCKLASLGRLQYICTHIHSSVLESNRNHLIANAIHKFCFMVSSLQCTNFASLCSLQCMHRMSSHHNRTLDAHLVWISNNSALSSLIGHNFA